MLLIFMIKLASTLSRLVNSLCKPPMCQTYTHFVFTIPRNKCCYRVTDRLAESFSTLYNQGRKLTSKCQTSNPGLFVILGEVLIILLYARDFYLTEHFLPYQPEKKLNCSLVNKVKKFICLKNEK